jgi:hypothetical protein
VARSSLLLYTPARIGLIHGRSGFVWRYNGFVELDVEGSSPAGSYSQQNRIKNYAIFHPPSVLLNAGTAQPKDNYPRIVSIPVDSYYGL